MKQLFAFIFFILTTTLFSQQLNVRTSIKNIVDKLGKDKTLHLGAPVGFAGIPETGNKYYKLYKQLENKATDTELLILTNDTSKTILLYSFTILFHRNFVRLKDIFIKYQNDKSEVWESSGCTGVLWKTNSYMLQLLNPKSKKSLNKYLTEQEYDDYFKKIGY